MTPGKVHTALKLLKCPHYQDPRRSPYFPSLCESCARFARLHLESVLQDWIYCGNDNQLCSESPHQHNNVFLPNPTQFLQQLHNDYYGEFFVQIKSDRVYVIAKYSNNASDFINDVKMGSNNGARQIYFCNTRTPDTGLRADNADPMRRNYNAPHSCTIGEIYYKFDISEVNVHLDIINDSHIMVYPIRSKEDIFTFVYQL